MQYALLCNAANMPELFDAIAEQWADALHQWLGITDDHVHMVSKGKDCQLEGKTFQFLITSYNFVPKLKDQLQILDPQVVVLDEAHYIKASKVSS